MHLAQHHFQAQRRYFERSMRFALNHLFDRPYGLAGYQLDDDALPNGTVSIEHARGVMPDGLAFDMPGSDDLPPPLSVDRLFRPNDHSRIVRLTIPAYHPEKPNYAPESSPDGASRRFTVSEHAVPDETTGLDTQTLRLGAKNFCLTLDDADADASEAVITLPLARIVRDGSRFHYDKEFVPPLLHIGASPALVGLLGRLLEALDARSRSLGGNRVGIGASTEYTNEEIASFWLIHAIHSNHSVLRHHFVAKRTRPDELYVDMARLAGALCTFAMEADPGAIPNYDHDDPGESFRGLDRHIRENLEVIIPTKRIIVPLRETDGFIRAGAVTGEPCFAGAAWILAVRPTGGGADLPTQVPNLVKVCSGEHVKRIVDEARAALPLHYLADPPAAVSPRLGSHYFAIETRGPCWTAIVKSGNVGVYVPASINDVDVELIILLDS